MALGGAALKGGGSASRRADGRGIKEEVDSLSEQPLVEGPADMPCLAGGERWDARALCFLLEHGGADQ
jgi:hypothetical protein